MDKKSQRLRRAPVRFRSRTGCDPLCVHRTRHIYAQVISDGGQVLASASTLDKDLRAEAGGNTEAATE